MNELDARSRAADRAESFIASAKLEAFGVSEQAVRMAVDLLVYMQMQSWHEGATAAIDAIQEKVRAQR